jgi:teichuronic acid biosynthesis glycosyltransferase TuaH
MHAGPYSGHSWDHMVVICAANSYDGIKLADQHMAEQLSRLAPVLYVDPPVSRVALAQDKRSIQLVKNPGLRQERAGLVRLTPLVQPFSSQRGLVTISGALIRRHLRRAVGHLGGQVQVIISAWAQHDVFRACAGASSVYWAQDDFVGGADLLGLDAELLDVRERAVAAAADLIVAANPVVAHTWQTRGLETELIPYGVDVNAYRDVDQAPLPSDFGLSGPVVGFVGHINRRIDLYLLEAVADRGWSLLLVGPRDPDFEPQRLDALLRRPTVQWVGPKPFDVLPGYFRLIDVGLVPYRDSPFNRGSFPLKTLEYLAAGRGVVASDLPAIRWLDTDLISIASGPAAFADAVDRSLREIRSPALVERRRAVASRHNWENRAADMYAAITARRSCSSAAPARDG